MPDSFNIFIVSSQGYIKYMLSVNQLQKKGLQPLAVPSTLLWFCVLSHLLIWGNLQYTDSFTGL